jgi:hypothetical protein
MNADLRTQLAVPGARYDDGAASPAFYAVIKQIEPDISWCDHFKTLGEAASRVVKRLDRARRVGAPSPQAAAANARNGATATLKDET